MYKDILSPAEVDETISKQWDFMEALGTGVDRNDPATWDHDQWYPGGPGSAFRKVTKPSTVTHTTHNKRGAGGGQQRG